MAQNAYIGTYPFRTMTVADLLAALSALPPDAEVLFQLPKYGAYGASMHFTVEQVDAVEIPRREHHTPAMEAVDEETGETYMTEPDTQVWEAWSGVVIS